MMKNFNEKNWKDYIPKPVCEQHPEYFSFYEKAWELARDHVKFIDGMPQNPYMDEAFCETQVWIWDTCFMSLFCKFAQEVFPGVETFQNFYHVLLNGGTLPSIYPSEKEPKWTGAIVGQPCRMQVHISDNPPLFAWGEYENALLHGDKKHLEKLLYKKSEIQRHYEWLENLKTVFTSPNVHAHSCWIKEENGYRWEGGRSGMDNTPRGRKGETEEKDRPNNPTMLWLDAICQQALSANTLAKMFAIVGDSENEKIWKEKFEQKKNLVQNLYWDNADEFYYDIDVSDHHFYKVRTIASYWPLTAEIATKEQAKKMLSYLFDEQQFGGIVPFATLARNDGDFSEKGKYWRGGVWLPTAYATLKGLENYGFYQEAHELAFKLFKHMLATFEKYEPHTIWECYSPTKPEPATGTNDMSTVRPDFCGWSALGPISIYLEFVLGFHKINAFEKVVEWEKPNSFQGNIGVKNLHFGDIITDIVANETTCTVKANEPYVLIINGVSHQIKAGENQFSL